MSRTPNADRNAVLDRWALGMTARDIANDLRLKRAAVVSTIVQRARQRGDARAEVRGSPHDFLCLKIGIVRRSPVGEALLHAAAKRKITPNELCKRVLETVLRDNMLAAVLDDA